MYHEERVVNGVLCFRNTPAGEWIEYTAKELTQLVQDLRQTVFAVKAAIGE